MRAPELTTALWEHCIRTRVYVTPYPADVHDVAGVDTNVPGGCVIVLEPASFGPIPATIDKTKKPVRNCCFGLCGAQNPAISPRLYLINPNFDHFLSQAAGRTRYLLEEQSCNKADCH